MMKKKNKIESIFKMIVLPFILAIGFVSAIRLADLVTGSNDRDCHRVIVWRSLFMLVYAWLVSWWFQVDLCTFNGAMRWTLKTAIILAFPFVRELSDFNVAHLDAFHAARDYILAPLFEEVVFRGPLMGMMASSIAFSAAHLNRRLPWKEALAQLIITFIFGLYVYNVRVNTGSVLTCFLVHAICNFSGPPDHVLMGSLSRIASQIALLIVAILI